MRRFGLLMLLVSLALAQSSPVATQPFGPLGPRQAAVLNGCSENALFAVLNSDAGRECLRNLLPRASNVASEYSVFCQSGQWGCCVKTVGFDGCKYRGAIPYQRALRPPAVIQP